MMILALILDFYIRLTQIYSGIDQKISQQMIKYRRDPFDYGKWSQSKKQIKNETRFQRLKSAYLLEQISLADLLYLYAVTSNSLCI